MSSFSIQCPILRESRNTGCCGVSDDSERMTVNTFICRPWREVDTTNTTSKSATAHKISHWFVRNDSVNFSRSRERWRIPVTSHVRESNTWRSCTSSVSMEFALNLSRTGFVRLKLFRWRIKDMSISVSIHVIKYESRNQLQSRHDTCYIAQKFHDYRILLRSWFRSDVCFQFVFRRSLRITFETDDDRRLLKNERLIR